MSDLPVLYSFRRCPYAMRARMALMISGTPVRLREVVLKDKPVEMLEASPKGTVPVLVDSDLVIEESRDVMDWALARHDPEEWLSRADPALTDVCDGSFKHHLDRYKYTTRYDGENAIAHRQAGMAFLEMLEERLVAEPYLCGPARGHADISIFPFVRQFRIADPAWFDAAPLPKVRAWLSALMNSPLFASIMEKYPAWKTSGDEFLLSTDASA
ncbi:MAG: glutathione S-transferase [Pseudomonadota bacterium]